MIRYLLEASVCLAFFFLFYRLFLSGIKLLSYNRFYLLAAALLSLVIPLIEIPSGAGTASPFTGLAINNSNSIIPISTDSTPSYNPVFLLYTCGLIMSSGILGYRLITLLKLARTSSGNYQGFRLIIMNKRSTSSFFNLLFVPRNFDLADDSSQTILQHEGIHRDQLHSVDLIFFNLLKCLFWFNPVIYLFEKAIKLQHEFIADHEVSENIGKTSYQGTLIRHGLRQSGFQMGHAFAVSSIEKRLKMIDNINPTTMKKLRLFGSLPLMLSLMACFCLAESSNAQTTQAKIQQEKAKIVGAMAKADPLNYSIPNSIKGKVQSATTGLAIEMATITALPSGTKTTSDKQGNYSIEPEKGDTLLVYSLKGFEKMKIPRKRYSVLNVALSKKD